MCVAFFVLNSNMNKTFNCAAVPWLCNDTLCYVDFFRGEELSFPSAEQPNYSTTSCRLSATA